MRWRLVGVLVALTAIVLLVQDVPLAIYLRGSETNRIITELQRDAFLIAGRSSEELAGDGPSPAGTAAMEAMLRSYTQAKGGAAIVVNSTGILVAASDPADQPGRSFASRPEIQTALAGETTSGERDSETLGYRLLYVAVPVLSGPHTLGAVRLTYPASELDERVNGRVRGIAVVGILTLLMASGVAVLLSGTITRPIRRLQQTTAQLAAGDLTARAETDLGAPELRTLGSDLNTMANRLDRLVTAQRAFAADASHQLRTPLTALRLRLDQAAELLDTDPTAAVLPLDDARAETERLQLVIDGLLQLARAEGATPDRQTVDLAAIAAERINMWEPLAEEGNVRLELSAPPAAAVLAISGAAEQILDNYLDNAISVSPAGSVVHVWIDPHSDRSPGTVLTVSDSGPGLRPEQRARAFDRFWSERTDNAGTGLGLAIVSQLAEASGATVELRESDTGGVAAVAVFRPA